VSPVIFFHFVLVQNERTINYCFPQKLIAMLFGTLGIAEN
jgi:hypothetical protein